MRFFSKKTFISAFFFIFIASFGIFQTYTYAATAPTFLFLRDLREGDQGVDVIILQKLLNGDPTTQVSTSGFGSPGNESTYFGKATKNAVLRFQNKFADEVLRPAGATTGSGVVGLWTKLKLNQILLKTSVAQTPAMITITVATSSQSSATNPSVRLPDLSQLTGTINSTQLTLTSPSRYAANAGTAITFLGSGFSSNNNIIHFGLNTVGNISTSNSSQIRFLIPNVTPGRYDVSVSDSAGRISNTLPFMVTVPGAESPIIEKIEPSVAKFDEQIKITGTNFTPTGNTITSSVGLFKNLNSADGKSIMLTIPLPGYLKNLSQKATQSWYGGKQNLEWPIKIHVININGVSQDTASDRFTINI